jgi:hypothetical protein
MISHQTNFHSSKSLKQPDLLLMVSKPIEQIHFQLTLEPVLKPISSINPYPSIILNEFMIHQQSIAEMKDIMVTNKNNVFKEINLQ